jgi:hypothetical protein
MADIRNRVGRLGAQFQAVVEEKGWEVLAGAEMLRLKEQLRAEVLEQDNQQFSEAKALRPQSQQAPALSTKLGELIAIAGLWGGSRATG